MQDSTNLALDLKKMLIQVCNVKNCTPEDVGDEDPLIGGQGKLRLDSLDAVEIVSALELNYGLRLNDPGEARKVLQTFTTLHNFVMQNRKT
jgi:acyl carrier protein